MLTEIMSNELAEKVFHTNTPAAILFSSTYCGTCKKVTARIETIAGGYGKINFFKLDVTKNPQDLAQYQILHIPTLVFFKGHDELDRMNGDITEDKIKEGLNKLI
ncbi:MAG: thioredoxin family protein [Planctomycetes bacterium]|nr:thioredoxin family protein [Planctomycetota bacterium]